MGFVIRRMQTGVYPPLESLVTGIIKEKTINLF
jgi:hypothetical protein